jgi:hypothetical protein
VEEMYPAEAKPVTVLKTFTFGKNAAVVLTKFPVETYREGSKNQDVVLTRLLVREGLLIYPAVPRPATVLVRLSI